jgi:Ni2+-binding GTPase involved in maturation of urease and hydrogenase
MSAQPVRLVLLGGFLGAGKTTTIARLARCFQERGSRVGIITNDQADDMVDTRTLEFQGFAVEQVAGACFCCHFDELTHSAAALIQRQAPQVILAEPVGSCTDLVATVIRPLLKYFGLSFELAPYGVLLKPEYARLLLAEDDATLQSDASYIFGKQLEEADFIAVNKIDLLTETEIHRLVKLAASVNPGTPTIPISARTGQGFDRLMDLLDDRGAVNSRSMAVDYDRYARGEAELGWLNSRVRVSGRLPFSLDELLLTLASRLAEFLENRQAETAHVKISGRSGSLYGLVNLVDRHVGAVLSISSGGHTGEAELTINARVAIDPERLEEEVTQALACTCVRFELFSQIQASRSFRPGRPVPVHRFDSLGDQSAASGCQ